MLRGVFDLKFGKTNSPAPAIFIRFQNEWYRIDQTKFRPGIRDPFVNNILNDVKADIIKFCKNELKNKQPRDDYKELLDLTLIFLDAYDGPIKFHAPGATSHARWMAKAIYCLKRAISILFAMSASL